MAGVWETRRLGLFGGNTDVNHSTTRASAYASVALQVAELARKVEKMCSIKSDPAFTKASDILNRCQNDVRQAIQPATAASPISATPAVDLPKSVDLPKDKVVDETSNTGFTKS